MRVKFKFSLAPLLFCVVACSTQSAPDRYGLAGGAVQYPDKIERASSSASTEPAIPPWVTWDVGRDAANDSFNASAVLRGDDYARNLNWNQALKEYTSIKSNSLSQPQKLSLTHRIAGSYIGLDQTSSALRVLSEYFKKNQIAVDQTDLGSSIIFAYAYGSMGEIDQSLAWFSRVKQVSGGSALASDSAQRGVQLLLSALPHEQFEALDQSWRSDTFVNVLIAEERARRVRMAGNAPKTFSKHFWENPYALGATVASVAGPSAMAGARTLGVLLPLSGRFAALGNSVKNGIELALSSEVGAGYKLSVKDSGADSQQTRVSALDLVTAGDLGAILGPLISENSQAAVDIARDNRIPIISFSKSANFQGSPGVYRLGPSSDSQVESLLAECVDNLQMKKFGIAYPNDDSGREFAQYFRAALAARGLTPVYDSSFLRSDSQSLLALAKELEGQTELEGLFFPDSVQSAAKVYSTLSLAARMRIKLLGTASWDNPTDIANARTALNGVIFISPFFSNSNKPVVTAFLQAYRNKFGKDPDFLAAQGYDAATLALSVLNRQAQQGGSFVEALAGVQKYEGLTGDIYIDPSGELKRRFSVVQLVGDNLVSPPEKVVPLFKSVAAPNSAPIADAGNLDRVIDDLVEKKSQVKVQR